MELESLRMLIDVARRSSFAEVARDRGVDPSQISRVIGALERELGFRLFQRTTRRVALTEAGDLYLRRMAAVVEESDRARNEALATSTGPVGALRMTTSVAFGHEVLVPLVPRFRALHPKVDLDLILTDTNLDLVGERIDLAIRLAAAVSGDLVISRLMETRYRVCASPDYLERRGRPAMPSALAEHDCLRFALPSYRSRWRFQSDADPGVGEAGVIDVGVRGGVVASGAMTLRQLALAGQGPALLADWLVDRDIAKGQLVDLFPGYRVTATTFDTAVWLVYPSRSFLPQKVRVMIDFLRSEASGSHR